MGKKIKKLEAKIKTLQRGQAEAVRANQMKSEQIAAISHDVRTSMGGIISMSELLLGTKLDDTQQRYARTIFEQAGNLMGILNHILDISKLEAGRFELENADFRPAGILASVSSLMQTRLKEKDLALETVIAADMPEHLNSDPAQLRRAMFNLVDNAIKFTRKGKITLHLEGHKKDDKYLLKFTVTDTGIGLSPDEQSLLFNPYQQLGASVSRNFGGTGLGLSLVRKLAGLMGGEAGVESTKGLGSTFWFTALCDMAENTGHTGESSKEPDSNINNSPAASANILVAEDNRVNLMLITTYLDKFGYHFTTVNNGIEAVEALKEQKFDLVLMDIHMPQMDGIEATRAIRKSETAKTRIPIIALTANAMKGDRERYIEAGMDEYVSKPINAAELYGKINTLVNHGRSNYP